MSKDISGLRVEYTSPGLDESEVRADPLAQFGAWFGEAVARDIPLANAMVLATADTGGRPAARYVLLKGYDAGGFVFYTSSLSRKGRELAENPRASLLFYWQVLHRQVRIEGCVERLSPDEADAYFASRPRASQISAWAADQSVEVPDRRYLHDRVAELNRRFGDGPVPRPEAWSGYRVRPQSLEFWQGQDNRLHGRILYRLDGAGAWNISRLAP